MSQQADFSKLRELLANPTQDDEWNQAFCGLLTTAEEHEEYQELWLPYCEQHADALSEPIARVYHLDELKQWVKRAPFATFIFDLEGQEMEREEWNAIVESEELLHVDELNLYNSYIGVEVCTLLSGCEYLRNLRVLELANNALYDVPVILLANAPAFTNLEYLGLEGINEQISDDGYAALATSLYLASNIRMKHINRLEKDFLIEYADYFEIEATEDMTKLAIVQAIRKAKEEDKKQEG
jgi:hypothetical protein